MDSSGPVVTPRERELLAALAQRDEVIAEQAGLIERLQTRVGELEARLGQNPRNSSRPPSSEGYAKPSAEQQSRSRSKRAAGKTRRRPGKQPGSGGAHLARVADPDETVWHSPDGCDGCGADLADAEVVGERARQVFDLPEPRMRVTEHRALTRRCGHCHATTTARLPAEATAPACYGPRVRALVSYFSAGHFVPVERCAQIMGEAFGLPIATGTVAGMVAQTASNLAPFTARVRQALAAAGVVGVDETGGRVDGRLAWIHVASTATLTLLTAHSRRGRVGSDDNGVLPGFGGVAVHDGWAAYRGYDCAHALCNAHHLRELQAAAETGQQWAAHLADTLRCAHRAVKAAKAAGANSLDPQLLAAINARYAGHIAQGHEQNPARPGPRSKAANLLARLDERREQVLRFTVDFDVPFDNNQAERDLRPIKLQQKVSGCWRTMTGAQRFATTRSYISTLRKHGLGLLDGITRATLGDPWLPPLPAPR